MDRKLEQRANVKFCFQLGKSATETLHMLRQAYGDDAMSRTQCFEWYGRFKGGRKSLEDDERSGRPSTSITPENVEKIRELVRDGRRMPINDIADIVGVSYGSAQSILTSQPNIDSTASSTGVNMDMDVEYESIIIKEEEVLLDYTDHLNSLVSVCDHSSKHKVKEEEEEEERVEDISDDGVEPKPFAFVNVEDDGNKESCDEKKETNSEQNVADWSLYTPQLLRTPISSTLLAENVIIEVVEENRIESKERKKYNKRRQVPVKGSLGRLHKEKMKVLKLQKMHSEEERKETKEALSLLMEMRAEGQEKNKIEMEILRERLRQEKIKTLLQRKTKENK